MNYQHEIAELKLERRNMLDELADDIKENCWRGKRSHDANEIAFYVRNWKPKEK